MSAITIENDLVHYEVLGRGRPVILLHGWLGSWRYWVPAMQQLSNKYRTYALDLWGFGDSGKDTSRFDLVSQVNLLNQFMEKMGITKAALVGHDLGAAIVTRYATLHPDRVPRLMVVAPPLFQITAQANSSQPVQPAANQPDSAAGNTAAPAGKESAPAAEPEAKTMPWRTDEMRERARAALEKEEQHLSKAEPAPTPTSSSGPKSPLEAAKPPTDQPATEVVARTSNPAPPVPQPKPTPARVPARNPLKEQLTTFSLTALLKAHVDAGADRDKLEAEIEKSHEKVLELGIESFAGVDTLKELRELTMAAVAVYGANDTFLKPPPQEVVDSLKNSKGPFNYIPIENAKHFPMLENISGFTRLLLDFLEVPDVTKLEIKKTWERRVR